MSFEAFEIILTPRDEAVKQLGRWEEVVAEMPKRFPALSIDTQEDCSSPTQWFVSETECGLFQVGVYGDSVSSVRFLMRFAYSNPRSVYAPFCSYAAEMMAIYSLALHLCADHAPEMTLPDEIRETDDLCSLLLPAMDYNRALWQSDVNSEEEIALRPGDAVAHFLKFS